MDNEKDLSIEIKNISKNQEAKNNEISLNEVENDEGYQYIQIKNSDTFNNTKGLDTENNNDDILFKKLNETEDTTTKEMQETIDHEDLSKTIENRIDIFKKIDDSINVNNYIRDNSDIINDQSEREFFDKVIVRNSEPYKELTSENYSITICQRVTTVKFEGETFSYLTNASNDENFFYIELCKKSHQFKIFELDEYKRNHFDNTRIPYNQILSFTNEMNLSIQDLNKQLNYKKLCYKFLIFVKILITISVLVCIAYFILYDGEKFFSISENSNRNLFYGFCSICVLIVLSLFYSFYNDLTINYELCKIFLINQKDLEEIVDKWNQEYFLPNLNINASIPYTFPYIQITLQPNLLIYLEEHDIFS